MNADAPEIPFESAAEFRWSVMVPVYEGADLLRRTLRSLVVADLGAELMHIEVIDDASSDRPQRVVEEFGGRVGYWRQPANVGAIANFNTCLARSRGELVHILHGDDLVLPAFYRTLDSAFDDSLIGAAACRTRYIDDDDRALTTTRSERVGSGLWPNALDSMTISNRIASPSIAVRRSCYEELGGFRVELPHSADWEMWTRIASHTSMWFEDRPLVEYRVHGGQDTSTLMRTGENIRERRRCIESFDRFVEGGAWPAQRRRALGYASVYAGRTALGFVRRGMFEAGARQFAEAGRCLTAAANRPRNQEL